jgi:hypothetical protein
VRHKKGVKKGWFNTRHLNADFEKSEGIFEK